MSVSLKDGLLKVKSRKGCDTRVQVKASSVSVKLKVSMRDPRKQDVKFS